MIRFVRFATWKTEEVWDQPFSDFYKGFRFLPYYAIEQLYYGISPNSTYIGFNSYLERLSYDFPPEFYQYDEVLPSPNFYLPFELRNFILPFLLGKKKFIIFKPNTFGYNFFLGLFLYLIWRLGGGYRLSPLYDPEKYFPQFGFYDLRITPLSCLFSAYFKVAFYLGYINSSQYQDYYLYNRRSLSRGYIIDYTINDPKNIGKRKGFFAYFFWPIIGFFPNLIIVTIFHFFLRPICYYFLVFTSFITAPAYWELDDEPDDFTFIDAVWVKIYGFYLNEVIKFFCSRYPDIRVFEDPVEGQYLIAVSFYINYRSLVHYYGKRISYFFSKFFHYTFAFLYKFARQLYNLKENRKMNLYKDLVLYSQISSTPNKSFRLFPFQWLYTFMSGGGPKSIVFASMWALIDELPQLYKKKLLSDEFIASQKLSDLPPSILYAYNKSYYFESSLRRFNYLEFRYNFVSTLKDLVYSIIGYCYYFSYSFYRWIEFNLNFNFNNAFNAVYSSLRPVISYIVKLFKKWLDVYKLFFANFFYFFLYIFFLVYYEFRYAVIFVFDSLRYYDSFRSKSYFYEYMYDYWINFKNFFIASKFFRFFTREIGEDLEETAYSNIFDFEDEEDLDFVSTFAAYQDIQKFSNDSYDEGYQSEDLDARVEYPHYYDYWLNSTELNKSKRPIYPNLEFFADDLHSQQNELSVKTFVAWINPSALTLQGGFNDPLPYEAKDYFDFADNRANFYGMVKKGDWFPFRLTHQYEHDEDAIEFTNREQFDQSSYIEHLTVLPIPRDTDRYRLANFVRLYSKNLDLWHSYQINNNFYKLPAVLKANTISIAHNPSTKMDWIRATHVASKFFISPQELEHYNISSSKQLSFSQIDKIWEKISYEVERNPRKLYDFLTDNNQRVDAFGDTFFSFSKFKFISDFTSFFTAKPNILVFLDDYFSSYINLSDSMKANSHYYFGLAKLDVIYTFNYLQHRAEYDFANFYSKFLVLSQYKQFKELETTFQLISKYVSPNSRENDSSWGLGEKGQPDSFVDKIIYEYVQWFDNDTMFPVGHVRDRKPFSFIDILWSAHWLHYVMPREFLNKYYPGLINDFYEAIEDASAIYSTNILPDRQHMEPYQTDETDSSAACYENIFSLFLEQNFGLNKLSSAKKFFKAISGSQFRDYRPENFIYYLLDGEDQAIRFGERQFDRLRTPKRSYFDYDQPFEGEIWAIMNPNIEDFFYESYYLNNLFFPSNFKDIYFEELFPDDFTTSSHDIYDDYVYYIADDYMDFATAEGDERQLPHLGEYNDDDPDTLDSPDQGYWHEVEEYAELFDEHEQDLAPYLLTPEDADSFDDPYWFSDQWWFHFEHTLNDEGLEEWEVDEYDAFYDVDMSVDRLFFGGLARKGAFPATDQRLFLGPLWASRNLDKDLDYSIQLKEARKNAQMKSLVASTPETSFPLKKKRFTGFRFLILYFYRVMVYLFYYVSALLTNLYFVQSYSFNFQAKISFYKHYYEWHQAYNAIYSYKERVEDWVKFFETYLEPKTYKNYKLYNSKHFIAEPQNVDILSDPYGRFWFQYPHTTYFREFAFYSDVRFDNRYHLLDDAFFEFKDGKPYYSYEKYKRVKLAYNDPITGYKKPSSTVRKRPFYGAKRTNVYRYNTVPSSRYLQRFYANDPFFDLSLINRRHKKKLRKITPYPWFFDRTRPETLGSDFTYMDLDFVEGLPENTDFPEPRDMLAVFPLPEPKDGMRFPHFYKMLPLYNNRLFKTSSGAAFGINIPYNHELSGLLFEENDWDIGTMVSFSTDDINSHVDEFRDKFDIFINAFEDFIDLFVDYSSYYFHSKFRTYVSSYFKYWEIKSENYWLDFSVRFGIWVLVLRNFINISLFLVLFFYGFFAITRIWYYIFGEIFIYSWYSLFTFFFSFFLFFFLSRLIFKGANDFYKSMDMQDKLDMFFFAGLVWYAHILNGYLATDDTVFAVEPTPRLLSNNFDADFREGVVDWIYPAGRVRRLELNQGEAWGFRKGEKLKGRYHDDAALPELTQDNLDEDHNESYLAFAPASYVPMALNPRVIYNFVRFHIFEIYEQNFVGYTAYEHHVDKVGPGQLNLVHTGVHRPQMVNWQAMLVPQAREWIKRQILDQVLGGLSSRSPYNYHSYTSERHKGHHMVNANHVNERLFTLAPDVTASTPYDVFPYDVHPKFSHLHTLDYQKLKLGSELYNTNEILSGYNNRFHRVKYKPFSHHLDVYPGVSLLDRTGKQLRARRYKRKIYRGGFRTISLKPNFRNSIFENAIDNHWTSSILVKRNFLQKYSQSFRKYLLYYNPVKAQSIRDIYGLALRDVYPFPEINEPDQTNPMFFESFRKLNFTQRKRLLNLLKSENFESARLLLSRYNRPEYKQTFFPFYDTSVYPVFVEINFWEDYVSIYNEYYSEETKPESWSESPARATSYYNEINRYYAEEFQFRFSHFLMQNRMDELDNITNFFKRYMRYMNSFKAIKKKPDPWFLNSEAAYYVRIAQINRTARAAFLDGYFIAVKFINKQAHADYVRESLSYIKPYAHGRTYRFAAYRSFLQGLSPKPKFTNSVYDPFYFESTKDLNYISKRDNRVEINNSDLSYLNPVYHARQRKELRYRRRRKKIRREVMYFKGRYNYWIIDATLWNIFLDFIMVRDLFDNARSYETYWVKHHFPYKYRHSIFRFRKKKILVPLYETKKRHLVTEFNLGVELFDKKTNRPTPLSEYLESRSDLKTILRKFKSKSLHRVHESHETYIRYTYWDHITAIAKPRVKAGRLNFRRSNIYARWRRAHWLDLAKRPEGPNERHKKPFFGVGVLDHTAEAFLGAWDEEQFKLASYTRRNHILKAYTGVNMRQRSFMQYPRGSYQYGFPFNQRMIKYRIAGKTRVDKAMKAISLPLEKGDLPKFKNRIPRDYMVNPLKLKQSEKLWYKPNNYHYRLHKILNKHKRLRKKVLSRVQLENLREISKSNRKKFLRFNRHTKRVASHYKRLHKNSNFAPKAQLKALKKKRDIEHIRMWYFLGMVKADQERGDAAISITRVKKRKHVLLTRKKKQLAETKDNFKKDL